jgi:hypothetical protein
VKRLLGALLAAALTASAPAWAGWGITADVERFRWSESSAPSVTETGPMFGIGARYTQNRDAGWLFGWRGRLYFGSVDYNGALLDASAPATGRTDYSGIVNEVQAIYRLPGSPAGLELVGGLIWDYWNRQLTVFQKEQYWIASLRVGLNADRRQPTGWFGGAGVKYPFYTRQDAHLTDIDFNANPRLKPKGDFSLYADAGYRFTRHWSLTGYYDSYRFGESDPTPFLVNPFVRGCTGVPPDDARGCQLVQPASKVDSLGLRLQYTFQ